jgi:hypothetical protein
VRGEILGSGVAQGDGRVLRAPRQKQPKRPAHGDAAANHGHLSAGDLHAEPPQQHHDAVRRARQRAVLAEHQFAQVHRMQAVSVLLRVHQVQHALLVQARGQRELHDVARAGRILVELEHRLFHLRLGGVGRQVTADRRDPDLGAVPVLARHVGVAARVVADEDRAKPGHDAPRRQRCHPLLQVRPHLRRCRLAVQNRCAHVRLGSRQW